jgi:hypothetical protein
MSDDKVTLKDFSASAGDAARMRLHRVVMERCGGDTRKYDRESADLRLECLDREQPLPLNPRSKSELHACALRIAAREHIDVSAAYQRLDAAKAAGGATYAKLLRPHMAPTAVPVTARPAAVTATVKPFAARRSTPVRSSSNTAGLRLATTGGDLSALDRALTNAVAVAEGRIAGQARDDAWRDLYQLRVNGAVLPLRWACAVRTAAISRDVARVQSLATMIRSAVTSQPQGAA